MIYLDNAATTMRKPPEVVRAVTGALQSFGGAGRGAHGAALAAGMAVYEAREALARLFDAPSPGQVAFCANATEALNVAIAGLLPWLLPAHSAIAAPLCAALALYALQPDMRQAHAARRRRKSPSLRA